MKTAKEYIKGEMEDALKSARELADKAEEEGRTLTDDERGRVESFLTKAAELKAKVQTFEDSEKLRKSIDELGASLTAPATVERPEGPTSIGDAFVKSDAYRALRERGLGGRWSTGQIELPYHFKTTLTEAEASGGDLVQPMVRPGINVPGAWRLTVADLFAQGTTDSNMVRYLAETTTTNAADAIYEAAAKPESALVFTATDEPVKKIATFLPVSDEMLEDVNGLSSYLNARLAFFVQQEEEDQILNAAGADADLDGILNRATATGVTYDISTPTQDNLFDAVLEAIINVQTEGFLQPDAIVINPTDWGTLSMAKAGAGTAGDGGGAYYSGGPYANPAMSPWGVRMVVTPSIAQGTVLVGAFKAGGQVFRRGGLTVEASNSHSDFFQKNLTAIRAEERLALAVYRPAAFCVLTIQA